MVARPRVRGPQSSALIVSGRAPEPHVDVIEMIGEVPDDADVSAASSRVLEPGLQLSTAYTMAASVPVKDLLQPIVNVDPADHVPAQPVPEEGPLRPEGELSREHGS